MRASLVLVSLTPIFGGGEVYYERLAALLFESFDIRAIVSNEELSQRFSAMGIETHILLKSDALSGWKRLLGAANKLRNLALQQPISTVHLNGQAEANLMPLCKSLGLRTVITRHTDLRLNAGALKRALYRHNASRADAVICVSERLKREHAPFIAPDKLHFIPHWISPGGDIRKEETSGPFTALFIGRVEQEKGILELVAAARALPDVQFLVAGDGSLRRQLDGDQNPSNLRFLGYQSNVASLFSLADLLVLPSHCEGSPLVVVEAMANFVPCLLSDIPALREIAKNGSSAALFPCGNVAGLVGRIRELREDPSLREALIRNASDAIKTEHSPAQARIRYTQLLSSDN